MTIVDFESTGTPKDYSCEVAIVGAGAVGIAMAVELTRRGHDVILLEAGGVSLEARSQEIFATARSTGVKLDGLRSGRYRLLGGTTNFWGGQLVPFDPIVFENRSWANSGGWPIGYGSLKPYYQQAMTMIGMDGAEQSDENVWARAKTEIPFLGRDLELFLTRWTKIPNFAKAFRADLNNPSLTVLVHANVVALEADETGNRIFRAHLRSFDGRTGTVSARRTVLACGTIEIARLLMLPYLNGQPTPWGDNPWLGRAYIDHLDTTAGSVTLRNSRKFKDLFENLFFDGYKYNPKIKLSECAQRRKGLLGIGASFVFRTSYEENAQTAKLFLRSILNGKLPANFLKMPAHALALSRVAVPLAYRYFRDNRTFHPSDAAVIFRVTSEQIPQRDSRITLRQERDALNMPIVDLNWSIDGAELETIAYFSERVRDALKTADLADLELEPSLLARDPAFLGTASDTYHQMGGARMGSSSHDGVVDRDLRVYGIQDLFVAGAAVMPSSGFANCTLSAIALGLRLCDHLTASASADRAVLRRAAPWTDTAHPIARSSVKLTERSNP